MLMFEYIGVLISVILGLGITHLVVGVSKIIQDRDTIKHYWVHVFWTVNVLIYILAIWWGMYWWTDLVEWSIFQFFFITLYSVVLFLLAAILYPWDVPKNLDFSQYFFRNKNWFFSILIVSWLIDISETILKGTSSLRDVPAGYAAFIGVILSISIIGIVSKSYRVHAVLPIVWFSVVVGYVSVTNLAKITT